MTRVVWLDGVVVPAEQARVSVLDRGFLYGDSVYEVVRARDGRPFQLGPHLDRLQRSATAIGLGLPARAEIEAALATTLAAAAEADAYVRIMVTRGAGAIGLRPSLAGAPTLVILVQAAQPPPPELYRDGVAVVVVNLSRAGVDPRVKSGNYLPSVLGAAEAERRGAYECLFTDGVGRLTEGGSSNLFLVRGGVVSTPPEHAGLLPGITRQVVLELCRELSIPVEERPLWPIDARSADEAFITSSIREILPVVRVDDHVLGNGHPGGITQRIMSGYAEATRRPDHA